MKETSEKERISESEERFKRLQKLLFEEDREIQEQIKEEVTQLQEELREPEDIQGRIEPFIDQKLDFLRENFPEMFGPALTKAIKRQIEDSQDEMIDALYPIIGKLIRKFIQKEFERINENIDRRVERAFSLDAWKDRVRSWFSGNKKEKASQNFTPVMEIQEMYIIEKDSGLLAGVWSRNATMDQDMIAGMLEAIRSFVETAFQKEGQDLNLIEYESYKIWLHGLKRYTVAIVIDGYVAPEVELWLTDRILEYVEIYKVRSPEEGENALNFNSKGLKEHFETLVYETK